MDPVTAGLNLATAIVALLTKVWDATPDAQKAIGAADAAKVLHNCSQFLQDAQDKLLAAAK